MYQTRPLPPIRKPKALAVVLGFAAFTCTTMWLSHRFNADWLAGPIGWFGEKASVVVQPATATAELKFASAHDLRRSCADRLIAAGVPEREVAAVMRHSSVSTTQRHYAPGSAQRSACVILERFLSVAQSI